MILNLKAYFCFVIGVFGSMVTRLFGGWTSDMKTLVIFMAVDFITGLITAGVFKKSAKSKTGALDSNAGWKGLCKKCVTLLFVLVAQRLDITLGTNYIRSVTVIGFITNELISIVENAGIMGLPMPEIIKKAIDILKNKSGEKNENQ